MATAKLPAPGATITDIATGEPKEVGPCVEPCEHTDCALTRGLASFPCTLCGQPIGYETAYYRSGHGLYHAACSWDEELARSRSISKKWADPINDKVGHE